MPAVTDVQRSGRDSPKRIPLAPACRLPMSRSAVVRRPPAAPCRSPVVGTPCRKKLMKPAPAMSTLATAALCGQRASPALRPALARILAGRLGQPHGKIAGEIAVLRIAGVLHLDADAARVAGTPGLPAAPQGLSQQFFDQSLQRRSQVSGKGSRSLPQTSQSTSSGSTSIDQRKPGRLRQPLDLRQPAVEKALQSGS